MLAAAAAPAQLDPGRVLMGAALATAGLLAISTLLRPTIARRLRLLGWRPLSRFVAGANLLGRPKTLLIVLAATAAAWLVGALGNLWTLAALGVPDPALAATVLLVALYAGMPVPSLPGRLGLHQAISLAALAPFALGDATALAAALIVYVNSIALPTVLGLAAVAWGGRRLTAP